MKPLVRTFFDEGTFTATHVVTASGAEHCAIIDPVLDYDHRSGRTSTKSADQLIAYVNGAGLRVSWILETHAHADHLSAAPYIKARLGGHIVIGEHIKSVQSTFQQVFNLEESFATDGSQFDYLFRDGEEFSVGEFAGRVLYTPGHTPACVTYRIGDAAFVGDTFFMPDYGTARCDFPGGNARTLYASIKRLLTLPPETRLFLCHDYKAPGRESYVWETTVSDEKARNVHVHDGVEEDDFVRLRTERDRTLTMPVLLFPSVQVNIRAGLFPPPEPNGTSYLKIPLNAL